MMASKPCSSRDGSNMFGNSSSQWKQSIPGFRTLAMAAESSAPPTNCRRLARLPNLCTAMSYSAGVIRFVPVWKKNEHQRSATERKASDKGRKWVRSSRSFSFTWVVVSDGICWIRDSVSIIAGARRRNSSRKGFSKIGGASGREPSSASRAPIKLFPERRWWSRKLRG